MAAFSNENTLFATRWERMRLSFSCTFFRFFSFSSEDANFSSSRCSMVVLLGFFPQVDGAL